MYFLHLSPVCSSALCTVTESFRAKLFRLKNIWDEGSMNVFLFRFLLISKSAIKYKRNWSETRNVFVLFFPTRSGLPIFFPPTQTNNNQTLIQKLHSFCCCFCCMEYKAFHLLGEEEKWIRKSSEEIYICIIFCCFKRQIKFYLFLCSNEFPVFFCVCWEIRDIYWWRWDWKERAAGRVFGCDPFRLKGKAIYS